MLNNLDSSYGGCFKGPAGLYGCSEAFLPTMFFSVFPDPAHMGVFSGIEKDRKKLTMKENKLLS